jgi:hypothetical protein
MKIKKITLLLAALFVVAFIGWSLVDEADGQVEPMAKKFYIYGIVSTHEIIPPPIYHPGGPAYYATIRADHPASGEYFITQADESGHYHITATHTGEYRIRGWGVYPVYFIWPLPGWFPVPFEGQTFVTVTDFYTEVNFYLYY